MKYVESKREAIRDIKRLLPKDFVVNIDEEKIFDKYVYGDWRKYTLRINRAFRKKSIKWVQFVNIDEYPPNWVYSYLRNEFMKLPRGEKVVIFNKYAE